VIHNIVSIHVNASVLIGSELENDARLSYLLQYLRKGICPEAADLLESALNKNSSILPHRYSTLSHRSFYLSSLF
jgi:hypothetical protein